MSASKSVALAMKKRPTRKSWSFFNEIRLAASEMLLRSTKYASLVQCASRARRRISFHIATAGRNISQFPKEIISHLPQGKYFTKNARVQISNANARKCLFYRPQPEIPQTQVRGISFFSGSCAFGSAALRFLFFCRGCIGGAF